MAHVDIMSSMATGRYVTQRIARRFLPTDVIRTVLNKDQSKILRGLNVIRLS